MLRSALLCGAALAFITPAQADCAARAEAKWAASSKLSFTIEAITTGKTCETAVALLIIRNAKGTPLHTFVAPTESVAMLAKDHRTGGETMAKALKEWISLDSNTRAADFLMPWPQGSNEPPVKQGEEFPFTVNSEISRETYEDARKSGHKLFCFVQGMESEGCVSAEDADTVNEIGIQQFPG